MARKQVCWTIEEDIFNWLMNNAHGNISEFVNECLLDVMKEERDDADILKKIEEKEKELANQKAQVIREFEKRLEDGNKKEREEAEALLKDQERVRKEKEQEEKNFIEVFTRAIERYKLQEELENLVTFSDVMRFLGRITMLEQEKDKTGVFIGSAKYSSVILKHFVKEKNEVIKC